MANPIRLTVGALGKRLHSLVYMQGKESIEGTISLKTESDRQGGISGRAVYEFQNFTSRGNDFQYDREDRGEYEGNRGSMLECYLADLQKAAYPAVAEKIDSSGHTMNVRVRKRNLAAEL